MVEVPVFRPLKNFFPFSRFPMSCNIILSRKGFPFINNFDFSELKEKLQHQYFSKGYPQLYHKRYKRLQNMQSLLKVVTLLTTVHSFCLYGQLKLVPVVCHDVSLALYNVDISSRQTINADGVLKGDGLLKGICDESTRY